MEFKIKLSSELKQQIQNFDKSILRKQIVHFVNFSPCGMALMPKTNGVIIIGQPYTNKKPGYAEVYRLGASIMHEPFKLSKSIKKKAKVTAATQKALWGLEDQEFPSVEHFLRALLFKKFTLTNKELSEKMVEEILFQATFPNTELQSIVKLNEIINGRKGAMLPAPKFGKKHEYYRKLFALGSLSYAYKAYPCIEPDILRDIFQQQQIYARYMDEKAGIGKATTITDKLLVTDTQTSITINSLIHYKRLPHKYNLFNSNCNKAAANLLQLAENESAKKQKRIPRQIKAASIWAIGYKQPLFLWNPLDIHLKTIVNHLIEQNGEDISRIGLQNLANYKRNLLHIISTLSLDQKIIALKQIFNQGTLLHTIFYMSKTGDFFAVSESRGSLHKAKESLTNCIKF